MRGEFLSEGVLEEAAPVDRQFALDEVELGGDGRCCAEQTHVAKEELEQIMLLVHLEGELRCRRVVAGEGDSRVGKPHEVARVALGPCRLAEIGELEALVLRVELGGKRVEYRSYMCLVIRVLRDVLAV